MDVPVIIHSESSSDNGEGSEPAPRRVGCVHPDRTQNQVVMAQV